MTWEGWTRQQEGLEGLVMSEQLSRKQAASLEGSRVLKREGWCLWAPAVL